MAQNVLGEHRGVRQQMKLSMLLATAIGLAGAFGAACSGSDPGGSDVDGGSPREDGGAASDGASEGGGAGADGGQVGARDAGAATGDGSSDADASMGDAGSGGPDASDGSDGSPAPVPVTIVDNRGNVDAATETKLRAGGSADPSFAWLYPYDGTVFPLGIGSPSLQWAGAASDAYLVRVSTSGIVYEAFYGAGAPAITIDAAMWQRLLAAAAPAGTMRVEATILRAGAVTGPRALTWTIAPAALPGVVYYAELNDARPEAVEGAVVKLRPAAGAAPITVAGQAACAGCHSVSADGATMVTSYGDDGKRTGAVLDLAGGDTSVRTQADSSFTWGALTPDGTRMMSNGAIDDGYPPNVSGQDRGPRPSRLYDVKSGALVPAAGWDTAVTYALMPAFSPDAKQIAFNHYDVDQGHSLSAMDVDLKVATFSGLRDIAADAVSFLGWPSFTPDGTRVVYQAGTRQDYVTEQGGKGDLWITSSAAKQPVLLAALDGDAHLSFWPSVSPDAAGGYVWVAFTSRRTYGNTITNASQDDKAREKIWIAAIDPATKGAVDPSHPPFFLAGQDLAAANMRPTWTRGQ
jgi:hypothetical protein